MVAESQIRDGAQIAEDIQSKLTRHFGKDVSSATQMQLYKAVAMCARDDIMQHFARTGAKLDKQDDRKLYYLSVEFLMGRALTNNVINLGLTGAYEDALKILGIDMDISDIEEAGEPESGLGNGGLGRLAACFLDSLATLDLPAMGCGIRYEYGLFRQTIVNGYQEEVPDNWLDDGNVWEIMQPEESVEVRFGGEVSEEWLEDGRLSINHTGYHTVIAVPYDMPIIGYNTDNTATLRLWSAKSPTYMDMSYFNKGEYMKAVEEKQLAEVISKVLYPEDKHIEGKELRLRQHYFFSSATVKHIIREFKQKHGAQNLLKLPTKVAIQINDTHPSLAIPEMMRILLDEEGLDWDTALSIVTRTFTYTNHTVLKEALECWPEQLFKELLPRVYSIVIALNEYFSKYLWKFYPGQWDKLSAMSIVANGEIRMANLCVLTCSRVNGVSGLHAEILEHEVFRNFYIIEPYKYLGITNGVTPRRWLAKANPRLHELILDTIGTDYLKHYSALSELIPYAQDAAFMEAFAKIKRANKERLSDYLMKRQGASFDPDWIVDVQAKRLHEYKRQLLNALHIIYLYQRIVENPSLEMQPRCFIFAAKASPGYTMAKLVIRLVHSIAQLIEAHPVAREKLKVIFVENYGVTVAEHLIPAADVSEQLSTAGKEASGTGNMKFMLGGAITIGTLDGANVEMTEAVGSENIFIFGLTADEVAARLAMGYRSGDIYETNHRLRKVVDSLIDGTLPADKDRLFSDIYRSLLFEGSPVADPYFVLADFEAYKDAHRDILESYKDRRAFLSKAIMNTACSGVFSSDRTIRDYNVNVWGLTPLEG